MSLPSDPNDNAGHPQYPSPWTTRDPREGLRDNDSAKIICLAPDVCKTPIGSSLVPIPYQVVDHCGHDTLYTDSVHFTRQKAMVLRSRTTHVHGDKAGRALGIASGTVESVCEPIGHAAQVRAEGSPVIRHLDRFKMNSGNTQGEALFVRDTASYAAPHDTDPVPGSAPFAGFEFASMPGSIENPRVLPPGSYQVAQATGGTMTDAGSGWFGGGTHAQSGGATTTGKPLATPTLRPKGIWTVLSSLLFGETTQEQADALLKDIEHSATTPGLGLSEQQMSALALAAAEIRQSAYAVGNYNAVPGMIEEAIAAIAAKEQAEGADADEEVDNVRVSGAKAECDDICKFACECMQDREGASTYTECVARKMRRMEHYDPSLGEYGNEIPRYPRHPDVDGPRPEVSYDPANNYKFAPSKTYPKLPSSQYPKAGMPRPDISWFKGGKLWKIFELKFPTASGGVDSETAMQAAGEYQRIARKNGLDPETDLIKLDINLHCDCSKVEAKADAPC